MLALGPPMSLMEPRQSLDWVRRAASSNMERREREAMVRLWCRASEQKLQPPPQPRWLVMEVATVARPGTGCL